MQADQDLPSYHVTHIKISYALSALLLSRFTTHNINQSAEGAGGLGIIRSNKVGETE